MMKVRVLVEHENEFGTKRLKTVGSTYPVHASAAQSLIANGYVEDTAKPAADAKKEG